MSNVAAPPARELDGAGRVLTSRSEGLAHPLPSGMRDLLPGEADARNELVQRVLRHVRLHGYELVTPPAFELAEVLERGLGTLDAADVVRFIEPESGLVAALRPDMTPQIARLVATRLASEPLPLRLAYEGVVVRRRQGRARRHRQLAQAGVELIGLPGIEGDLEILRLAASALDDLGLEGALIDLGHAGIARGLLDRLPASLADRVADALTQKDVARVRELLREENESLVPPSLARTLEELSELHVGGHLDARAVLARGAELLGGSAAGPAFRELSALWAALQPDPRLASRVRLDLGDVRGFAYYTGVIFHVLAHGPGEPIGAGGRYDDLLPRFDVALGAVGFGLDLDAILLAQKHAGANGARATRVVVAGASDGLQELEASLRARGVVVARAPAESAEAYARAWRYTHVLRREGGSLVLLDVSSGASASEVTRTEETDNIIASLVVERSREEVG